MSETKQPSETKQTGSKLTEAEIKEILRMETETFGGNRRAACAAHVHGELVCVKCGGEPPFADTKQISQLKGQVTAFTKKGK